ncbi:hypothetical protein [Tepidibacillus sp. HK-1]|uniref:hypothetical protein n=1 Tax=Tepidibacillus sp. HK-1 TaxID=1883407 RepID=UPI000853DF0D|nr:hypothetical protein [Tepidibacillus sp. HK-1]GBF10969.1 hypothetical protein HK1_00986 [Tepidibacillus sp. HK-1]
MVKPSVIIVREQDELVAACCVPFDGEFLQQIGKMDLYLKERAVIHNTGELYQQLSKEFGENLSLDIVDPRNKGYLFPRIIKDVVRYKLSPWQAIKTIFTLRVPAVILNGQLLASGKGKISTETFELIKRSISGKHLEKRHL